MGRKATAHVDQRITELHGKHQTRRDIAAILTREGHPITASGVQRALDRLGLRDSSPAKSTHAAPPVDKSTPPAVADDEDDENATRLRRAIASLERAADEAEANKDVGRVVAAQKAITGALALLEKMTPPPAVSPDDRPDMIAAAQRGRERTRTLLTRLFGGAA